MRIVVLHAGGVGDLVLLETAIAALRARYPGATIEIACRAEVAGIVELYASPPDTLHAFHATPYRWALPNDDVALEAEAVLLRLLGAPVDLFISAELRATWLSEVLAAGLEPREALIADHRQPASSDILTLLGRLRLQRNADVRRCGSVPGEHELDRYARIAGGSGRLMPQLRAQAAGDPARELVVFPCSANVANRWPLARMGAVAQRVAASRGLAVVLIGSEANRRDMDEAVERGDFGPAPTVVVGSPAELGAVAARIARATAYVGLDTGLVHLAQAYGVPGAAVSGGGHWPAYAAWAPGSASVVAPIPCFGCEWDCAFERPFCTEGVTADDLVAAFETATAMTTGAAHVDIVDAYSEREHAILGAAATVHRAAERDRAQRLTAITRLRGLMGRYAARARRRARRSAAQLAWLAERTSAAAEHLDGVAGPY